MTTRELKIAKALLDVLHELDGAQIEEISLHARVSELTACSLAEFSAALASVNVRGWVNRIENKITRKPKWNINDAGEAARLEL